MCDPINKSHTIVGGDDVDVRRVEDQPGPQRTSENFLGTFVTHTCAQPRALPHAQLRRNLQDHHARTLESDKSKDPVCTMGRATHRCPPKLRL
ncbi:hypothetical protein COCVIDRAFT_104708 [Bipolaris victoriae FI3]|uniref:Uncharacterized protein n=1 Tax=Bipolaris victoriae (strain FI3) TaxID=930091 RepID=W7EGV7_BIPV3|nr:hypothetical protein COCVIDRAFT_104708 [Bipolaris victoriae FI3]